MGDSVKKTIEDNFRDWESHVFGFGYGSGEEHILPALKKFFELCPPDRAYDFRILERELTPAVAWLLINALCHHDILEYGTSPRVAWLTKQGQALKAFVGGKSVDDLIVLATDREEDYAPCYPDACICGPEGYDKGRVCQNPFWVTRRG